MAARSPSSSPPSPLARRSSRRSLCVGLGAEVHAVRSEASGLAGTAREVVADKSDLLWRGEEGSGRRRGSGRAGAAPAPVVSKPAGSWWPEGLSSVEAKATRSQLLEEELSSLKEELAQCQVSGLAAGFLVHRPSWGQRTHHCLPSSCLRPGSPIEPSGDAPSRLHTLPLPTIYLVCRLCPTADPGFDLIDALQRLLPQSPSSWCYLVVPSAQEWSAFMS